MDYEFWNDIHTRGGIPAVKNALEELAERGSPEDVDAAMDLACRVIEDDTARLQARADQAEARLRMLTDEAREVERQVDAHAGAEKADETSGRAERQ
ncbi:hypothetical protein [Streptomyces sp. BA2]|uniref:hypothetical protein n=1 Tax=Streptomyces sp. BA2 TaxID=436595 RepID=UPI001329F0C9|nr:hypothetical protein [Streptomyces sp. BA2]MWA08582.1 hypothetical protein [Streptomyces sp. BA2]